jgi:hypothetical protein
VSAQLHITHASTYNLVRIPPRERPQVLEAWYSADGGSGAHSGDNRASGPAAVPGVSLVSSSVRHPVASPYAMPSSKPKKQQL